MGMQARLLVQEFDGGSRGNPGHAGSGAVIIDVNTRHTVRAPCVRSIASRCRYTALQQRVAALRTLTAQVAELVCPLPYGCTNNEAE